MLLILFLGAWFFDWLERRLDRGRNIGYNDDGAVGFFLAEYYDGDIERFFKSTKGSNG